MNHIRRGTGKPLLLIHGLGGSWREWTPILDALAAERAVVALDLPGFGDTPPLPGEVSIATLADAVSAFLDDHELTGVDAVGVSMGGRLVLELARRGAVGATVALDPGGFWRGWERPYFALSIGLSIRLIRLLQPLMPLLTGSAVGRTLLFAQVSAHPWRLSPAVALDEMRSFAASPSFDALLRHLAAAPTQQGAAPGATRGPLVIGWGRQDHVCPPRQAQLAAQRFPAARVHWFEHSGHFPQWDVPRDTARLILASTG